jgi:hypothetical protein
MLDRIIQFLPLLAHYPSWVQVWVSVVFIIVLATIGLLLFFLPSALKSKKHVASIEFENTRPFVDRARLGDDRTRQYWSVYYFKIQIHNKSDETTIRVKHLKLTELRELEAGTFKPWGNAEPIFLDWDTTKPKDIPPQDKVLVPFARIFPPELQRQTDRLLSGGVDTPQLRFTVPLGRWPRRMTSHVPPGTHRFRITVYFEKVPPAEAELELEWSGNQTKSIDAMVQEIKVKKL